VGGCILMKTFGSKLIHESKRATKEWSWFRVTTHTSGFHR